MQANRTLLRGALGLGLALAAAAASAEDLDRGEKLYGLCTQCHGEQGQGSRLALAPAIAGLPQWYVTSQIEHFRGGVRGRHTDDVAGMRMRPMALSLYREGDVEAVSAFVAGMPPVKPEATLEGGDPAKGEQAYALCIACHGASGEGNKALQSPPISHSSDWYMLTQLQNYKAGIRGTDPTDMAGATMRPMAMTLADEQAMKDVIAFVMTLAAEQ